VEFEKQSFLENFKLNNNNQVVKLLSFHNLSMKIKYMDIIGEIMVIQQRHHNLLKKLDNYIIKKHHGVNLDSWFIVKDDCWWLFSIFKKYITIPPSSII